MEKYLLMALVAVFLVVFLLWYSLTYCEKDPGDTGDNGGGDNSSDVGGGGDEEDDDEGKVDVNVSTGKIKVDIVDLEGKSLLDESLDFVTSTEGGDVQFAPGTTLYTEGFQVKNIGDNPLKFTVTINGYKGTDKPKFEDGFDLYITTDPTKLENAEKLTTFTGNLEAGQSSATYYLVASMKTAAGNEYQNQTYTGIGITVHAAQTNINVEE